MATAFASTTRSLAAEKTGTSMIAIAVATVALLLWLGWFLLAHVTRFEVSQDARLEVSAEPRELSTAEAGRLVGVRLAIGQEVQAGEVVAELDATEQRARLREEEVRQLAYPGQISSLEREIAALGAADVHDRQSAAAMARTTTAQLEGAQSAAQFASDFEKRQRADNEAGGATGVDVARAAAEARKADSARDALAADARRVIADAATRRDQNAARMEELRRSLMDLQTEQTKSASTIAGLKAEIENRIVRAPVSGRLAEAANLRPGAFVRSGERLATIVPTSRLMIVADFDPSALGHIQVGQAARLRLTGFPWAQYGSVTARVAHVAGEIRDGHLRAELAVTGTSLHGVALTHGMAGVAEVEVERLSPARLILRTLGQNLQ